MLARYRSINETSRAAGDQVQQIALTRLPSWVPLRGNLGSEVGVPALQAMASASASRGMHLLKFHGVSKSSLASPPAARQRWIQRHLVAVAFIDKRRDS